MNSRDLHLPVLGLQRHIPRFYVETGHPTQVLMIACQALLLIEPPVAPQHYLLQGGTGVT